MAAPTSAPRPVKLVASTDEHPVGRPLRRLEPHNRVGGKYRLRRRIAVGGMGEVWVARNESTAADVALKVLRSDTDRGMQAEARFQHEAKLSGILSHRNIVKVFDLVEEADGTLILVMELLRGETLHRYLERKGPRSTREAVAILTPILSALDHAHSAKVVHRDVTPGNIFLAVDPDGQVTPKLVDFGIAKAADSGILTVDDRVLGTPRYMSPEQIRSQSKIDGRSDIFSAGVVLYEILTGAAPFAASTPAASLAAVLEAHIDPDPRIDPRLWVELQRAISKRPYERHATAAEFASALRAATSETDVSLAATLKRTHPSSYWDDEGTPHLPPQQTKSIEGQSIVLGFSRRRATWLAWIGGGMAVGASIAVTAFLMRAGTSAGSAPGAAPAETSTTSAAAPRVVRPATAAANTEPPQPTSPPPAALAASSSVAVAPHLSPPKVTTPSAPPPPPPKAKSVATTPGF